MYFDAKIVSVLNIGSSVSQLLHFFSEISSTTVCGYVWVCGVSLCVCPCADMHLCEHVCLSVSLFSSTSRGFRLILYIFSTNHHFCKEPSCILLENSQCLLNCSVVSNSLWPHGLQPTRFLCPRDSSGNSTGVSCHALVQGSFWSNWHVFCILNWQVGSLSLVPPGKPLENSTRHQNPDARCVYCYWVVFFFFTLSTDRAKNRLPLALCTYIYKHLHMCMLSHSVVSDSLWPDRL